MLAFIKNQTIFRNGIEYRVDRRTATGVQLENATTGEFSTHDLYALLAEYAKGALTIAPFNLQHQSQFPPTQVRQHAEPSTSPAAQSASRRQIDYIVKLTDECAFKGTKQQLINAIGKISQERNESVPPHVTTVYRWHKLFQQAKKDIRALFSKINSRGGKNKSRLNAEVEAIIDEKIESIFLAQKTGSAEEVHDAVSKTIALKNTTLIESEWLIVPSFRTIQRRISRLYAYDIAVARYGKREADRRYGATLASRRVSRILELVEIDHTPVDLMVVDDNRKTIGRPSITFVFDRYSRCVLGYHLSLAGHGTPAVFEALRHAMLPKSYIKDRYPDLNVTWECYGWMERLLMDNGREFHAFAVADALLNVGVISEFSGSREPNDKPFIERFNRTFNYSFIHRLPGTTLARITDRIGFKAENDACITLAELDKMIHTWILGVYHLRPHGGLGRRTPIEVWRESAAQHPPQLKANAKDLEIEFSESCVSKVQQYGIDLNTHRYASKQLSNLRCMLPEKKTSVEVKWPRHDVGHIHVWDPYEKKYFEVPNVDNDYLGLTLTQGKAAKRAIHATDAYQRTRASARDIVRDLVAKASADKKLKNRKHGANLANKTSKEMHRPTPAPDKVVLNRPNEDTSAAPAANFSGFDFEMTSDIGGDQ
ncbi:DDE-type integrase/transposase/recombinase [Duganella sp. FT135W]|uniref:DDE-type integrase/transposase/recombinase n=1 Tax=Duganella flavida TaxID=2692175 RepID=A0A6L8KDE2_9BURK|nr:DDE-type integrase/transposase/recombinase [Duganella flavida]MYM25489.1 DDE-type integrase/transposase/recombinase [Duganella flavida]